MIEESSAEASSIVAQYEALRMAMLGEALFPETRSGLMFFLRQGMWGWARAALAGASVRREPILAPRSRPGELRQHSAIVYVFAAMATKVDNRRMP